MNQTPSLNKQRVARVGSGIGAFGIIAAILIFLIQRQATAGVFLAAIIGVIGLSVWLTLAPDDLRNLVSGRQALYGSNSLLSSVLVAGIVAILYALANGANVAADLTQYRTYSLRPDVEALVKSLDKPAMITAFYTTAQLDQQSKDMPILRLFSDGSGGKIKINIVDPDQQPVLAQNFGASQSQSAFVTGVTADGQPDLGPGKIVALTNNYVGEQQIADALLALQARGKFKVLFTIGHGELNTDGQGDATSIRGGLDKVGITTGTLDLTNQPIPADTSALVILSPETDFGAAETDKIDQYLGNGGRVLLMVKPLHYVNTNAATAPLDVTFMQDSSPLTKYLWETWGIRPQNDIVFDPDSYVGSPVSPLSAKASKHEIMAKDKANTGQLRVVLTVARSLEFAPADQTPDVNRIPLFGTSDNAFGALNIRAVQANVDAYKRSDQDLKGPLTLAVAATNSKNGSRLVVVGDSNWINNDQVLLYGNALLWSNMMNWLTQFEEKTTVSPTVTLQPLYADTNTLNTVVVITLVILPGLVLLAGGVVWWDRARR